MPPLPVPQPGLSRTTGSMLAGFVIALVIGTSIVVGLEVRASTTSPESTYLASIRAHATLTGVSEVDLVRAGQAVCSAVAARPTRVGLIGAFIRLGASTGWSSNDAAAIVGSAVEAFCPQYGSLLR